MKKSIIALTALLCLGVPGVAVATDVADLDPVVLLDRIDRLSAQLADRDSRLERKSEILACERANRRELVRTLRHGGPGVVKVCR